MTYVSENFWHDAVNKATTDLFTFGYKHIIKPHFIFNQTPDVAHSQMIDFCKVTRNIPPLMWLCREMLDYTDPILETNVMGVDFANPFGLSAGLDKDCEMPVLLDNVGFGFETVGSTTSRPCPGNPRPWFHRLPEYDSMMVHVGLANEGSAVVIPRAENAWTKAKSMQVSVSIARTNDSKTGDLDEGIEDYCISMRRAAGRTAMVEVNISCPNTMAGEPFNQSPEALDKLFTELDKIDRPQPTLVKMPLNKTWPEFKDLLDVLAEHNVQGLSIANLQKDRTKEQLNAKGLGIKNAGTVASDQYDEGQIVSQTPDALTKAEANTTVEVTLSSGKGEVSVPSVTGMDETTAYNTLTNSGFTPVKDYAYSADVAQGNVIEQSPNAGSPAKAGDNVKIVISRGVEQAEATSVAVPGVTGLTEDAARSAIQNVGLAVGNVSSAYSDSVASGQIISQSPVTDTAVDAGTAVDFVVSMGAEPAQEVTPTTYKINLNIKKPNNESVAAANIYLYDGADGTGNILEQWTNQSISLFGEEGLSISKSGMLASSGSLKIDWLGADGQQLGSSQIVSPISFKAE